MSEPLATIPRTDPVFGVPHHQCPHWDDGGFVGGCERCHTDEYLREIARLRGALELINAQTTLSSATTIAYRALYVHGPNSGRSSDHA